MRIRFVRQRFNPTLETNKQFIANICMEKNMTESTPLPPVLIKLDPLMLVLPQIDQDSNSKWLT